MLTNKIFFFIFIKNKKLKLINNINIILKYLIKNFNKYPFKSD